MKRVQRSLHRPVALVALVLVLLWLPAAVAAPGGAAPVVVVDPGHDLRANLETEPIGPGSSTRKIKDGGGTRGVVSGLTEAQLNLRVGLRLRALLRRAGVRVVMTRTTTSAHEHGEHRPRPHRQRRRRPPLPPRSTPTASPTASARGTHTLHPGTPPRLDGRRLRVEQARGRDGPARARPRARLPRPRPARAERLHRLQLVGRPRDPRRDGLHDQPAPTTASSRRAPTSREPRSASAAGRSASSAARRRACPSSSASRRRRPRPGARRP